MNWKDFCKVIGRRVPCIGKKASTEAETFFICLRNNKEVGWLECSKPGRKDIRKKIRESSVKQVNEHLLSHRKDFEFTAHWVCTSILGIHKPLGCDPVG